MRRVNNGINRIEQIASASSQDVWKGRHIITPIIRFTDVEQSKRVDDEEKKQRKMIVDYLCTQLTSFYLDRLENDQTGVSEKYFPFFNLYRSMNN